MPQKTNALDARAIMNAFQANRWFQESSDEDFKNAQNRLLLGISKYPFDAIELAKFIQSEFDYNGEQLDELIDIIESTM